MGVEGVAAEGGALFSASQQTGEESSGTDDKLETVSTESMIRSADGGSPGVNGWGSASRRLPDSLLGVTDPGTVGSESSGTDNVTGGSEAEAERGADTGTSVGPGEVVVDLETAGDFVKGGKLSATNNGETLDTVDVSVDTEGPEISGAEDRDGTVLEDRGRSTAR